MAVRHEAEIANPMETIREDVEEKPADELNGLEPHDLGRAAISIVFPCEGNAVAVNGDEA